MVNNSSQTNTTYEELCSNFIWNHQQARSKNLQRVSLIIGILSIIGCIFNLFVFIRIISQNVRKSHFSKIYYLSLAVADFLVAACSVGYVSVFNEVLNMNRGTNFWHLAIGTTWTAIVSSLLHVIAISADRFIASIFPFYYYSDRHLKRKKVTIGIVCIWIASIFLVSSMYWEYRIAFWCAAVCIPAASIGIVFSYANVAAVSIKRHIFQRTGREVTDFADAVQREDIRKSLNTVLLGLFVTFTYVICNIPLSIAVIRYLRNRTCPDVHGKVLLHALLTANTLLDPLFYALFDLVLVIREKIRTKIDSSLTMRRRKTDVDNPSS